jgi:hypothetical protein
MAGQIPLISSGSAGPLGAVHLPRLWQKLLLGSKGLLHEDWDMCGMGFDQMTLEGLGLDREKTIAFVKENSPTYPHFEAWVRQNGTKLSAADIEKHNAAVRGYEHSDATRAAILGANGIKDDGKIRDAVRLNELEDWLAFHEAVS